MIAPPRATKPGTAGVGQARECADIEFDQSLHLVDVRIQQRSDGANARVVDPLCQGMHRGAHDCEPPVPLFPFDAIV